MYFCYNICLMCYVSFQSQNLRFYPIMFQYSPSIHFYHCFAFSILQLFVSYSFYFRHTVCVKDLTPFADLINIILQQSSFIKWSIFSISSDNKCLDLFIHLFICITFKILTIWFDFISLITPSYCFQCELSIHSTN